MSEFHVGDRVVIRNLRSALHLNGRHGCVATSTAAAAAAASSAPTNNDDADDNNANNGDGRYGVDLDLDPTQKRVSVRGTNLTREPPIPDDVASQRAGVEPKEHGIIEERHGRAVNVVLESMRYISASFFLHDESIRSVADIDRMRSVGPMGLLKLNYLMATGWSNWSDEERGGGTRSRESSRPSEARTMYQCLVEYIQKTVPDENRRNGTVELPPEFVLAGQSLDLPHAAGGWYLRIHGDFWIVGMDREGHTGTYLVPVGNVGAVYKVLGVRNALYPMIAKNFGDTPVAFTVTLIPWFGRLLYDGVVSPAGGPPGTPPQKASRELTKKLKKSVVKAVREGRVVDRIRELEVPGGTRVPADTPVDQAASAGNAQSGEGFGMSEDEQPPPTEEERRAVERLNQYQPFHPDDKAGQWVYRRMGYTERDNPAHMGFVMCGDASTVGPFLCSALAPTAMDIVKSLLEKGEVATGGRRPSMLMIDERGCHERLKFLLREVEGTVVEYYRPPSREEEAAAAASPINPTYFFERS